MKAKTANEKRVVELGVKLPPITNKQIQYAYNNLFKSYCYQSKKEFICFDCGHKWENEKSTLLALTDSCVCPNCGNKLNVQDSKARELRIKNYYSVITTCQEFQVVRNFTVLKACKANQPAEYSIKEVAQNWITPNGEVINYALQVAGLSRYYDQWIEDSKFEIRGEHRRYNINPIGIYPTKKVTEIIKRNGFKNKLYDITPVYLFSYILSDSIAETLLKANQISMLEYYIYDSSWKIKNYWKSICICIRNGYIIKDASMWIDYVETLSEAKKDVLNAKFVCPINLKKEHNLIIAKRQKQKEIEEKELNAKKEKERILKHEENLRVFNEIKSKFFGIEFSDSLIKVKVLESLEEYEEEGKKLFHCVFKRAYYGKPETLILSARINGEPIETIELSLTNFKVLQCRGYDNEDSEYHDKIMELVSNNVQKIRKRAVERIAA